MAAVGVLVCMVLFLLRGTGATSLKEQYIHRFLRRSDGRHCPLTRAGNSDVYEQAAVATDVPVCSDIGVDILKKGGSVMDSAIATLFCLGVINFQSVGLGGGGFLLYYNATSHQRTFLDFREVAPKSATEGMFHRPSGARGIPNEGGLAIGVPGQLKGMETAWKMHGRLPWADLVQPSIKIARHGFEVSKALPFAVEDNLERLKSGKYNELRNLLVPNDKPLKTGQVIKNEKMAETLSKIAELGADYLYNSSFTSTLVKELQNQGSIITEEDFHAYTVRKREVLESSFKGLRVLGATAPSGGALVALILNILRGYNISQDGISGLIYHRLVEAFRMAYTWRPRLGDPDFNANMSEVIQRMMSYDEADNFRSLIQDDVKYLMNASSFPRPSHVGTTHLSVLGPDGDAVAITSTLNDFFGSLVYSNTSGIIFNDEMFDFCEDTGYCPHIKPGSRPRSSMSPTILLEQDGRVKMVIGASGGSRIPTGITQVLLNVFCFNMSLSEAVAYPRIHHQINPDEVDVEREFPEKYLDMLRERGHEVKVKKEESDDFGFSVVQAVEVVEGKIYAISDSRKGGAPSGF